MVNHLLLQAEYQSLEYARRKSCITLHIFITFYEKAFLAVSDTKTWMCLICGWIYDEAAGDPEHGVAPGTLWADVPLNWTCPECGARKEDFELVQI
jgi:rubredoxin